jgi:hypothetical protein
MMRRTITMTWRATANTSSGSRTGATGIVNAALEDGWDIALPVVTVGLRGLLWKAAAR